MTDPRLLSPERMSEITKQADAFKNTRLYQRVVGPLLLHFSALQWHPIETAPRDGTEIIVRSGYFRTVAYFDRYWQWGGDDPITPTHWTPLLTLPDDEEESR